MLIYKNLSLNIAGKILQLSLTIWSFRVVINHIPIDVIGYWAFLLFIVELCAQISFNPVRKMIITSTENPTYNKYKIFIYISVIFVFIALIVAKYTLDVTMMELSFMFILTFAMMLRGLVSDITALRNDYHVVFGADVGAFVVKTFLLILFVLNGYGLWSFIFSSIIEAIIAILVYYSLEKWPIFKFFAVKKTDEIQNPDWNNYVYILSNEILKFFSTKTEVLIIKYKFGLGELGTYNRSAKISRLPLTTLGDAIQKVLITDLRGRDIYGLKGRYIQLVFMILLIACTIFTFLSKFLFQFLIDDESLRIQVTELTNILIFIVPFNLSNRLQNIELNLTHRFGVLFKLKMFTYVALLISLLSVWNTTLLFTSYSLVGYNAILFIATFIYLKFGNKKK